MIGFWISAGAMAAMVVLLMSQSLRLAQRGSGVSQDASDLIVYRDQLSEVDRDQARGLLAPTEAERLRTEVQRRMLEADRNRRSQVGAGSSRSLWLALGLVIAGLGVGLGIYSSLGAPGYPDLPLSDRLASADQAYLNRPSQDAAEAGQSPYQQPSDIDAQLAAMIDKLRAAVASRPDDLLGHSLLAQNEAAVGNFVAARKAQGAVVDLKGGAATAEDWSLLAHLMIAAAGGTVSPEAEKALVACLKLDPTNGWARYYSGLMFAEIGRPDRTFAMWEPLLSDTPDTSPWIQPIRGMIEDVASAAGIAYSLPPATKGPDADDVAAAAEMSAEDRAAMIRTMVGGLESRLMSEGGTSEDWAKLIASLGVLQEGARAKAAYETAQTKFVGKPGELAVLRGAAVQAGVAE